MPIPQNGQTHSNNLSAIDHFVKLALKGLKINVFEIPDNKNVWKLFPKYELLFLDQANCSFDPSQILIYYDFPYLELPLLSHHLYQVLPGQVLYWFPHFVLPHLTTCHHKYWMYQIICQVEPIKFIIKPYTDCSTL